MQTCGADQFSAWRDTHLRIEGPAVGALQLGFVGDWNFAHKGLHELDAASLAWGAIPRLEGAQRDDAREVTICNIGPHQRTLSGDVLFTTLLEAAEHRLWIATPYFVPDDRVISTLKSAGLRGVDVRIIVPAKSDHNVFPKLHEEFARELEPFGVRIFTYAPGFMHQKVILVDCKFASIGSANFDNRSFRLNFEIVAVVYGAAFCTEVEAMLQADLESTTLLDPCAPLPSSWWYRLATRSTRLLAPVL